MKKALLQRTQRVHFGDAEDILSTSFLNEELGQVPDEEKDEEEKRKEEIKSRVQQALGADDVSMLKHLLVEIPDLVDNYLHRPLAHIAAEHGALKILQECVSKPADSINAATSDFEATTPLFWAIREGKADVVDWLLSNGAFHQPLNVYQDSAVYVAVYHNQIDILGALHTHKCDCNMPNRNGDLPLMHVIRTGNTKALDRLIEMGVDIYGRTANGQNGMGGADYEVRMFDVGRLTSPMHWVLVLNSSSTRNIIETLFNSPSFVAAEQQPLICSLISIATALDTVNMVSLLCEYLEDPEALLDFQKGAIMKRSLKVQRFLYEEKQVPPDIEMAISIGSTAGLKLALECGASVHGKDVVSQCIKLRPGWTSSYVHYELLQRLELLLNYGADINMVNTESQLTPIYYATKKTQLCAVLWLLRAGCDMCTFGHEKSPILAALNSLMSYYVTINMVLSAFVIAEFMPYHNDPSISLHLSKTKCTDGTLMQSEANMPVENPHNTGPERDRMIEAFNTLLTEKSTNPPVLQHLCRFTILQALGSGAHRKIKQLELPSRIEAYVMLEDLENMCQELRQKETSQNVEDLDHRFTCLCTNYGV